MEIEEASVTGSELAAEQIQVRAFRRMTPGQRLAQSHRLWQMARQIAEAGVRQRHPGATHVEIRRHLARLFLHGND